ncbi:MAG: VOC family protein [Acidobacteriia bacterium]|nr:VOC family protein [Terriglobia bacterium]
MRKALGVTFCSAILLTVLPATRLRAVPDEPKPTVDLSIYRHAVHIGWVVNDLDRVVGYWEKLGLKNVRRDGVREFPDTTFRGKKTPVSMKMAFGDIGGVMIEWIEPVQGKSVYNEFLQAHGDGVQHLAYPVASPEQLEEQLKYFKARGVDVVQRGSWQAKTGKGLFAYLDTAPRGGGLTIELVYDPDPRTGAASENEYPFNKITQYAFCVHDDKKVSAFYEGLGFGGMPIDHSVPVNRLYRGQPGKFEMYLGWWRWGDVTFEWIQSLVGPSIYDEYLKKHGEGFHHLAFNVKDMDEAVKLLEARGAPASQTGGWDSPTSKGRFAYMDTEPYGGVTIELLWNQPMTP